MSDESYRDMVEQVARAFDVPLWTVGIGEPPSPPTGWRKARIRAAVRIGDAGWHAGSLVVALGRQARWAHVAGGRVTDAGDWLADRVAGRVQ